MSQTAITLAFEQWKASQAVTGEPVLLDEFVFANVPGLDASKPIDRSEKLPPAAQIVHRQVVSRKSGFFYALHPLAGISLFLPHKPISLHATNSALARPASSDTHSHRVKRSCAQQSAGASQHGQKNLSQTKIALHRTRLRFLDHKNFSVLFFYKPDRQTAPVLAALRRTRTEKIEKNFSVFHFCESAKDRMENVTNRKIREILILCEREGSFRWWHEATDKG